MLKNWTLEDDEDEEFLIRASNGAYCSFSLEETDTPGVYRAWHGTAIEDGDSAVLHAAINSGALLSLLKVTEKYKDIVTVF